MPNLQQNVFTSTVSLFQGPDTEDINPDEIFVLSEEFISGTEDNSPPDKDEKNQLYRYFVEDRRTSGSLTLLRVSSLSDTDVLMEKRKREKRRKIRRTNTFSHC